MPNQYDLTNQEIKDTYGPLVQYISGSFYNLLGESIPINSGSTESASYALTSSYASTASYYNGSILSASYSNTASYVEIAQTASYYNGSVITSSYSLTASYSSYFRTLGARITTEDSYITSGSKGYSHISHNSRIVKARILSNVEGNIDVNIRRNNILLGNINLTNQSSLIDSTLSGWTTNLNTNDLIEFHVSGSSLYITDVSIFIDTIS